MAARPRMRLSKPIIAIAGSDCSSRCAMTLPANPQTPEIRTFTTSRTTASRRYCSSRRLWDTRGSDQRPERGLPCCGRSEFIRAEDAGQLQERRLFGEKLFRLREAVAGKACPEFFRLIKSDHGRGKARRIVSYHGVRLCRERHSFNPHRSGNNGHPIAHAVVKYAFNTGPEAQRGD